MRVKITIQRFNPESDVKPHFRDYTVEAGRETTVLLALLKIKSDIDGSLTFRASCRAAICGSCQMLVNGVQKLACNTSVLEELDRHGALVISPMTNMPVIKDMVVDMAPFWEKIKQVKPYVVTHNQDQPVPTAGLKTIHDDLHHADACIMCGACLSACNSFEVSPQFLGPAALAKAYRIMVDPRDEIGAKRMTSFQEENGIWDCVRCVYCVQVCPKEVEPMEQIVRLRRMSIESGMDASIGARHITQFVKVVGEEGRLNESRLPLYILRNKIRKLIDMLPIAIKMFFRGKAPKPFVETHPGHQDVVAIYKTRQK
ncbi:MAG: succinate dehydrogenase/fumarate reductase iron-sulfur subunit [Nitrospiria bacterium]